MARLPSKYDISQPISGRSGRAIASYDTSGLGRGVQQLGAGIANLGADLSAVQMQANKERTATEAIAADGGALREMNDFVRTFDADGDYGTFGKRAEEGLAKIRQTYASKITDPRARAAWEADYNPRAESARNKIADLGETKLREGRLVEAKTGLQGYQSVIANPDATDEERLAARRNAEASIDVLKGQGLLDPSEADTWREDVIDGGDFVYGKRAIERDPSVITGKLPPRVADRSSMAMKYFQSRGWSKEQAAGIVGNLLAESTLNTGARNAGDGSDGSDSIGIGQWNSDRAKRLKDFAALNRADWRDFGIQLAFVDHELNSNEKSAGNALRSAGDIQSATDAMVMYERPAGSQNGARNAHNYSGRLKFAHQAAGETIKPDWYQNQTPDKQLQLENMAQARDQQIIAQDAVQRKAIQSQTNDDYRLRIAASDPTLTQQSILDDTRIDNGDKATLLNLFNEKNKEGLAIAQALPLYQAGKLELDPYAPESKKVVDGIQDKITSLVPPEQQQGATDSLIKQTGIVPQSTFNGIRAGMDSTDTGQVAAALQQASRISQINPAALGRRDGGAQIQDKVDDFTYYVNNLNMAPAEAAKRIADMNNPDKLRERKALEPAAKEFAKQIQEEDLGSVFDESYLPFNDPQIGFTEGQALGIQAEYQAIAQEQFYKANGNPDLAKNRAKEELKRLYGVTNITGKPVVMKYPPERYWPANTAAEGAVFGIGADPLGYAKTQLYAEFAGREADFDPDSVQFVTTPATEAMIKRGEMPAYAVMYSDKDGQLQTFPGKLWRPDFAAPKRAMENQQQQRVEDAAAADQFQRERIIPGQDREQTLDNFLDGDPLTGLPTGNPIGGGN